MDEHQSRSTIIAMETSALVASALGVLDAQENLICEVTTSNVVACEGPELHGGRLVVHGVVNKRLQETYLQRN